MSNQIILSDGRIADDLIRNPKFKEQMEAAGYVFSYHFRPYDFYIKGKEKFGICPNCRVLSLNGHRIKVPYRTEIVDAIAFALNGEIEKIRPWPIDKS